MQSIIYKILIVPSNHEEYAGLRNQQEQNTICQTNGTKNGHVYDTAGEKGEQSTLKSHHITPPTKQKACWVDDDPKTLENEVFKLFRLVSKPGFVRAKFQRDDMLPNTQVQVQGPVSQLTTFDLFLRYLDYLANKIIECIRKLIVKTPAETPTEAPSANDASQGTKRFIK